MSLDLHIGQVLYVVSDKNTKVVPVVVSEQAVVKTLEGDTITWKVIIGPKGKRKTIELNKINGEKFASLYEAKMALLKRFEAFLNEATNETEKNVKEWYDMEIDKAKKIEVPKQEQNETGFDADSLIDQISETPHVVQPPPLPMDEVAKPSPTDTAEQRKAKLRAMLTPDPNEMVDEMNSQMHEGHIDPNNVPEGVKLVIGPDGEQIPVIMGDQ